MVMAKDEYSVTMVRLSPLKNVTATACRMSTNPNEISNEFLIRTPMS